MLNFLTFKTFISVDILILAYYLGAVIMPVVMWFSKGYLQTRFHILDKFNNLLISLFGKLTLKKKILSILLMVALFISMEIVWRMCFELMIGYFQMVEALKVH